MMSLIAAGHSRQQAAHSAHSPPERFSPEPSPQLQIPFAFVYMASGNTQQKLLTNSFHACAVTLRGELVPLGPSAQGTYLSLLRGVTSPPPPPRLPSASVSAADFPHTLPRSACSSACMPHGFLPRAKCARKPIPEQHP